MIEMQSKSKEKAQVADSEQKEMKNETPITDNAESHKETDREKQSTNQEISNTITYKMRKISSQIYHSPNKWYYFASVGIAAIGIAIMVLFCSQTDMTFQQPNEFAEEQKASKGTVFVFGCLAIVWFVISWFKDLNKKRLLKQDPSTVNLFDNDTRPISEKKKKKVQWNKKSTLYVIQENVEPIVTQAYESMCEQKGFTGMCFYIIFLVTYVHTQKKITCVHFQSAHGCNVINFGLCSWFVVVFLFLFLNGINRFEVKT